MYFMSNSKLCNYNYVIICITAKTGRTFYIATYCDTWPFLMSVKLQIWREKKIAFHISVLERLESLACWPYIDKTLCDIFEKVCLRHLRVDIKPIVDNTFKIVK